ncbi:MAG: hypothetical protein Q8M02_10725 [Candidatus Didemnitutus sp.]|nr:hypothetical protein [Candidatus Didemnitutus sp.]
MDEALQNLENELKALRPRRPSVLLRAQLEKELGATPVSLASQAPVLPNRRYTAAPSLRSWKWVGWPLAAAASVALVVSVGVWQWPRADAPVSAANTVVAATAPASSIVTPRDAYKPVKADNVLYAVTDEGLVLLDDNSPARLVRARYVDTYTWHNPATNASMKWSVPRDEVRMIPTRFH